MDFQNVQKFNEDRILMDKYLKFLSFINLPCGHVMSHIKFGPDRFSRFDVYWIQTNRQTDKPNLYLDIARISVEKWTGAAGFLELDCRIFTTKKKKVSLQKSYSRQKKTKSTKNEGNGDKI